MKKLVKVAVPLTHYIVLDEKISGVCIHFILDILNNITFKLLF